MVVSYQPSLPNPRVVSAASSCDVPIILPMMARTCKQWEGFIHISWSWMVLIYIYVFLMFSVFACLCQKNISRFDSFSYHVSKSFPYFSLWTSSFPFRSTVPTRGPGPVFHRIFIVQLLSGITKPNFCCGFRCQVGLPGRSWRSLPKPKLHIVCRCLLGICRKVHETSSSHFKCFFCKGDPGISPSHRPSMQGSSPSPWIQHGPFLKVKHIW